MTQNTETTWELVEPLSGDLGHGLRLTRTKVDGKEARYHLGRWIDGEDGKPRYHKSWTGFLTSAQLVALRAAMIELPATMTNSTDPSTAP